MITKGKKLTVDQHNEPPLARIVIQEGQEFVIGNNIMKWEYSDKELNKNPVITVVDYPVDPSTFSVSVVPVKKIVSRRKGK